MTDLFLICKLLCIIFCFLAVDLYDGEELNLFKVSRQSMGAYLCIASNGVPPAISRRMHIDITCKYTM